VSTIVIAPDSFKGTVSATAAAAAIARGWAAVRPDDSVVLRPMADGGEGILDVFETAVPGATRMPVTVTGPGDADVASEWLLLPDGTGVIELALASGLHLLDPLLPLDAHSFGFGQLIVAALDSGVERVVLGIGGSACTDGGVGMLTALGAVFLDADGEPIARGNRGIASLASVDLSGMRLAPAGSVALTDVTNPLLGARGAAWVFGPQKGATDADCQVLDANLTHLAQVLDLESLGAESGAGAAGGVGFGLLVWGAGLVGGSGAVADLIGLPAAMESADLVITGEGRFDDQTASGKVAHRVATMAGTAKVPLALVAGSIDARTDLFVDTVNLTTLAGSSDAARGDAEKWLVEAGRTLAHNFAA
jgi:glycerate kinase